MAERDVTDGSSSPTSFEDDGAKPFAFTNPIAFDSEESNAKASGTSRGALPRSNDSFESSPRDKKSASAAKLERLRSEVSADDVASAPVLPESLESTTAGSAQLEAWKEQLVEHIIQGKENMRDKRRREAAQTLQDGSLIDPNGRFRKQWDMLQIVLLIYVAFSVPYRSGFSHSVELWSGWFWFDAVVDVYFLSDLVVSFKTAYYDGNGELVVDPKQIRRNYLRSWFAVDFSSCFPGNYISYAVEESGGGGSRMIKLLRMLRLLKLLRLARLNRLIRRYEEEFAALLTTFKLAKLVVLIIVVGHWLGCLFFGFGNLDDDSGLDFGLDPNGEKTVGWVARHFDAEQCGDGKCLLQKYLTSFYWAVMTMTTVGYGDITPHTKYEMGACIVAMIIGGFIFGTIVGNLAELSKRANAGELMRQKAVSRVQIAFTSGVARGVMTPDLIRRIKAYYNFQNERNATIDLKAFVQGLSTELRDEMAERMHWIDGVTNGRESFGLLHKVPFLTGLSNAACITICAGMKVRHLVPRTGDVEMIMEEGADCEEMFFVVVGSRSVVLERDGTKLGTLSTGDFFGELGALLPPEMKLLRRRTRTAYAIADVQIGILSYDDLLSLRREFFEVNEKVVTYTNQVLKHLRGTETPTKAGAALSMLDPYPALQLLDKKLNRLLDQKASVEAVRRALPEDRQEAILQKRLLSMGPAQSRDVTE